MGVISFSEDKIWGASSRLIYAIVEFSLNDQGKREYLIEFKRSFDHGYKIIYLEEINNNELRDFLKSVKKFSKYCDYSYLGFKSDEARNHVNKLIEEIENLMLQRTDAEENSKCLSKKLG